MPDYEVGYGYYILHFTAKHLCFAPSPRTRLWWVTPRDSQQVSAYFISIYYNEQKTGAEDHRKKISILFAINPKRIL